jgi:hypothetical protein
MASPIENAILTVDAMYPWAREATMDKVFAHSVKTNLLLNQAIVQMGKGKNITKDIVNAFGEEEKNAMRRIYRGATDAFSKILGKTGRDTDPIVLIANLAEQAAWGIQSVNNSYANSDYIKRLLPNQLINAQNITVAAGAALFTAERMIAEFASEQEKMLRAMINFGMVASDLEIYTSLRDSAAMQSMSLGNMIESLSDYNSVLVRLNGNTLSGYTDFLNFANVVHGTTGAATNFGYTGEQLTKRLADEARFLINSSLIDDLNNSSRDRITSNFYKTTAFAIGLANKTGIDRDNLLRQRAEALNEIDHVVSIRRLASLLENNMNTDAVNRSELAYGELAQVSEILGPEFSKFMLQWVNRTQFDIEFNTTAMDNIPQNMVDALSFLGEEAIGRLARIVEKTSFGDYQTPGELSYDFQQVLREIRKVPDFRTTFNDATLQASHLRDMAWLASESFMDATQESLNFTPEAISNLTETAGAAINGMDTMRQAMLRVYSDIAPGFEAVGNVASIAGEKITALRDLWAGIFEVQAVNVTTRRQQEERRRLDRIAAQQYLQGTTGLNENNAVRLEELARSMSLQTGETISGNTGGMYGVVPSMDTTGGTNTGGGYVPINVSSNQPWAQDRLFLLEVDRVAQRFGFNPNALLGLMASESGLNPQARNSNGGATGLIQFMPNTARGLGTTTDELIQMSRAQQMMWVEKYFEPYASNLAGASAGKLYAYVFLPGRASRDVLTSRGENYYNQNVGLDMNRDGAITIADLDSRIAEHARQRGINLSATEITTSINLLPGESETPVEPTQTSANALPPENTPTTTTTTVNEDKSLIESISDLFSDLFGSDDETQTLQPNASNNPEITSSTVETTPGEPINTNNRIDTETIVEIQDIDEEIIATTRRVVESIRQEEEVMYGIR